MSAVKLAKFRAEALYGPGHSPATYSLEAFVGTVDYDKVRQQLLDNGSMFTSPAATAAYLNNASQWDDRAESYLRHVISYGQGHGTGAVPGTFPTHIFEMNWIVATLLHAGFELSDFAATTLNKVAEIVSVELISTNGLAGHVPQTVDADDTAKALLSLKLMGRDEKTGPDMLLKVFERHDGFSTFGGERDRSLSTNCHILLMLLAWGNFAEYAVSIRKAMFFIISYWWNSTGRCRDKWHLSPFYARMLTLMASVEFLSATDTGSLAQLDVDSPEKSRLAIILFQICNLTLREQSADGSWGSSREETAYAILTLTTARRLCLFTDEINHINMVIKHGVDYLLGSSHASPLKRLWTSKTMYSVKYVAEGYELAALRAASNLVRGGDVGQRSGIQYDLFKLTKFRPLLEKTRHFRDMHKGHLSAALMEAALWLPLLRAKRLEVFPRDNPTIGKDAYVDLLPFLWTGCIYRSDMFVSNKFVNDMLFMTLINIQVDEFIEGIVTPAFSSRVDELHSLIDRVLERAHADLRRDSVVASPDITDDCSVTIEPVEITEPLLRFVEFFLRSSGDTNPHPNDHSRLKHELASFLHTQTQQMEDNVKFGEQPNRNIFSTETCYFDWVRTIAADHVSTPFTWAWVCCWISSNLGNGAETFSTPTEKYLAAATARHLAVTNRMFNDLGSIARDTREGNLNSVHFPEFHAAGSSDQDRRAALQLLAEYEHSQVESSRRRLEEEVKRRNPYASKTAVARQKMNAVGLLCDVASLWDQLYCLRDLSSSIRTNGSDEA